MNHTQGRVTQGDHSLRYAAISARISTEDQGKAYSIAGDDWAARVLSFTEEEFCRSIGRSKMRMLVRALR
jgi:hypothetical protein